MTSWPDLSDAEADNLLRMACQDDSEFPASWRLRPGGSWAAKGGLTTLVAYDPAEDPDGQGRRPSDINAGTVLNPYFAKAVCDAYNQSRPTPAADLPWQDGFVAYYGDDGLPTGAVPVRWHGTGERGDLTLAEAVTLPPCPLLMCDEYALLREDGRVLWFYDIGKVVRAGETLTFKAAGWVRR